MQFFVKYTIHPLLSRGWIVTIAFRNCDFVFAVCGPPNLPAGAVIHLVWEPCRVERQPYSLEAVCLHGDLPHYAVPLSHLLDRSKV